MRTLARLLALAALGGAQEPLPSAQDPAPEAQQPGATEAPGAAAADDAVPAGPLAARAVGIIEGTGAPLTGAAAYVTLAQLDDMLLWREALSPGGQAALRNLLELRVIDAIAAADGLTVTPAEVAEQLLTSDAAAPLAMGQGNVDRIRNIIFGPQMRLYERRFKRIEEELQRQCDDLRADLRQRVDALEGFIKSELESLVNRLKSEQTMRNNEAEDLRADIAKVTRGTDGKLAAYRIEADD